MSIVTERWTAMAHKVPEYAVREALAQGHNYVGTEHLLLAAIRAYGKLDAELEEQIRRTVLSNPQTCPTCKQVIEE